LREYNATGIIVTAIITKTELNPVILTSATLFKKRRLRVTTAMDSPKECDNPDLVEVRENVYLLKKEGGGNHNFG